MWKSTRLAPAKLIWIEALERMAAKGKPFFVRDGRHRRLAKCQRAVHAFEDQQAIGADAMQHQLHGQPEKLRPPAYQCTEDICDDVPDVILGLSDHTHALAPVSAAVTAGCRGVIERHFTDSNDREGPDHKFAMKP